MFKKSDLKVHLEKQWASAGVNLDAEERLGVPIDELVEHSRDRNENIESEHLNLWLAVFDELISWVLSLGAVLSEALDDKNEQNHNFRVSVFLIISKIIADSFSIRHLIVSGFDTQAKLILRSSGEYMEVLSSILHDPSLANEFIKTDTPEGANLFWKKYLKKGKIRKRMKEAWFSFGNIDTGGADRSDKKALKFWSNWGSASYKNYSSLSHPSIAGGLFSAIPLKSQHTEEAWLGIWGDKSDASVDTIFDYCKYLFPVLLLFPNFPFNDSVEENLISVEYDEKKEYHLHIKHGRSVLSSLILSLCKETNIEHVFPETDYSIFPD